MATTTNTDSRVENKGGLSALMTLLLSPVRSRNRITQAPIKLASPITTLPINSPTAKTSTASKPERKKLERRKSLQAMLGSDAVFDSFIAVAQKVFNVPIAVVCHVQSGPSTSRGRPTMASKGGIIDRTKFDGMKRDANSRFYALFPEGKEVCLIEDCQKDEQVEQKQSSETLTLTITYS